MGLTIGQKIRVTGRNAALGLQGGEDLDALSVQGHMVKGASVPAMPGPEREPGPVTNVLGIPESWGERQRALSGEHGRPVGARGLDGMALMAAVESDAESAGARLREINATGEHPLSGAVPLPVLIGHMDKWYSGDQLKTELDAVLGLCRTSGDRAEVRRYARVRLAGGTYEGPGVTSESRTCPVCRKTFVSSRSDKRFCATACRVKASRAGRRYG